MAEAYGNGTALIAGGGSGIGRLVAGIIAREGGKVAIADINIDNARTVATEIADAGGTAKAWALDVADSAAVNATIADIAGDMGPIAYLFHVAGVYDVSPAESITDDAWDRIMRINATGTFHTCRAVLPAMMERKFGAIVTTTSIQALRGQPNGAHYAAAKGAIISYTKSIAREKATLNIRANIVAPGPLDTAFFRRDRSEEDIQKSIDYCVSLIPSGRMGYAEDVAPMAAFLLGPSAAHITGQVISINGGEVMT